MTAYYNEFDPYAAAWLRNLITEGLIAPGYVDERSIVDVRPDDLKGYTQVHFFAGIGGWSLAARIAGWPDSRPLWTGSCPCQPFSAAGKRKGFDDVRHLWPVFRDLIAERRPAVVFGEQVAAAADWLRLVRSDLEAMGRAVGAIPIEAASAGADHLRDRFWFVTDDLGDSRSARLALRPIAEDQRGDVRQEGAAAATSGDRSETLAYTYTAGRRERPRPRRESRGSAEPSDERCDVGGFDWVLGADGKARRIKPGVCLLVDGFPGRVGLLRGFGNAIDPRPAAAFIKAYMLARSV